MIAFYGVYHKFRLLFEHIMYIVLRRNVQGEGSILCVNTLSPNDMGIYKKGL